MFVRVVRKQQGYHFTVVDIQPGSIEREMQLVLDLGIIQPAYLGRIQAWYAIAENLVRCDLDDNEKRKVARDLVNWLPPLSREDFENTRRQDLDQLKALQDADSPHVPWIPVELSESDPLDIIASWLDEEDNI
jgi:hypothetical protein